MSDRDREIRESAERQDRLAILAMAMPFVHTTMSTGDIVRTLLQQNAIMSGESIGDISQPYTPRTPLHAAAVVEPPPSPLPSVSVVERAQPVVERAQPVVERAQPPLQAASVAEARAALAEPLSQSKSDANQHEDTEYSHKGIYYKDPDGEEGTYYGQLNANHQANGFGEMRYSETIDGSDSFWGEFRNGKMWQGQTKDFVMIRGKWLEGNLTDGTITSEDAVKIARLARLKAQALSNAIRQERMESSILVSSDREMSDSLNRHYRRPHIGGLAHHIMQLSAGAVGPMLESYKKEETLASNIGSICELLNDKDKSIQLHAYLISQSPEFYKTLESVITSSESERIPREYIIEIMKSEKFTAATKEVDNPITIESLQKIMLVFLDSYIATGYDVKFCKNMDEFFRSKLFGFHCSFSQSSFKKYILMLLKVGNFDESASKVHLFIKKCMELYDFIRTKLNNAFSVVLGEVVMGMVTEYIGFGNGLAKSGIELLKKMTDPIAGLMTCLLAYKICQFNSMQELYAKVDEISDAVYNRISGFVVTLGMTYGESFKPVINMVVEQLDFRGSLTYTESFSDTIASMMYTYHGIRSDASGWKGSANAKMQELDQKYKTFSKVLGENISKLDKEQLQKTVQSLATDPNIQQVIYDKLK